MAEPEFDGTVTSKLKPVVTLLTEALVRDFELAYAYAGGGAWLRRDEDGGQVAVTEEVLREDVRTWLHALEAEHEDQEFARMVLTMIRKNRGWVTLLAGRVIRRLKSGPGNQ